MTMLERVIAMRWALARLIQPEIRRREEIVSDVLELATGGRTRSLDLDLPTYRTLITDAFADHYRTGWRDGREDLADDFADLDDELATIDDGEGIADCRRSRGP